MGFRRPALLAGLSQLRCLTLNNWGIGKVEGYRRAGELQFHDWDGQPSCHGAQHRGARHCRPEHRGNPMLQPAQDKSEDLH
ncbi:hypothetical protein WJX72_008169 [[Myrmecia] bisecta]|uniref:Uncharacterized protein n=1 Tax=[Myrmecia] bisecta TaxID=41462 RepID=A0AAW1P020_9CHLO